MPCARESGVVSARPRQEADDAPHERLAHVLRALSATTRAADVALDGEAFVDGIASAVLGTFADACIVDVVAEGAGLRREAVAHTDASCAGTLQSVFAPEDDDSPVAGVLETGRAIAWLDLDDAPERVRRVLAPLSARSVLVVAATSQGRVVAVMTFLADHGRPAFDAYDLAVAREIAARLALGLEHSRLYRSVRADVRARDDLIAAVSHDLRDPLSAIGAGAAALRRVVPPTDATVARAIELVERNAERMQQLVGNLLDLARHESAGLPLDLAARSPRGIVYEALETLGPLAAQKRLQLEARMPAELPEVRCDRHATVRVLTNLVGNAIKFTPPGGAIRVRVEPLGSELRITVSDTGPGIARAELGHVFDRYWQARSARSTARSGAGLGLSIAKAIVEQSGGSIGVESHVGVGTTFYFTVPIA